MKNRILSLILALVMVVGLLPASALAVQSGFAADAAESVPSVSTSGPLTLGASTTAEREAVSGIASSNVLQAATNEDGELTKFESGENTPFSETEAASVYSADETVTFIVVTEDAPLLSKFSVGEIAAQTASVNAHKDAQTRTIDAVKARMNTVLGSDAKLGYTYTIGTSGFSVDTAYGNKAKLEAMEGVKSVYVAPTFALPEDMGQQELSPQTANSSTMIGADVVNASGYTGKGQRIAILDTGILVSHPNFQEMSADRLEDPMTRESVEEIWNTLNASERTTMLNLTYVSNKIPFAFNYETGTFDVSNTYAGSDHGTHVAGIAAANKISGSDVIGVAPDAQLVVMQVFQNTGGASWATIMAALEDCVRLEVDAANLSLGAAAGFTDPADDMLATMNLFLESDIQVLIASGNDTNNAYRNLWGLNMSLIQNPDTGLTGTPGTYSAALTVASANNNGDMMLYFTVDGTDYGFSDTATTTATSFIQNFLGKTLDYVVVPGVGAGEDYEGLDVTGKIALVSRGTTSFPEKQATAQAHGAIGCVIYNNTTGLFLMQINDGEGNIPCVSVSASAGAAMIAAAGEDKVGNLTVCNADTKKFTSDTMMSDFSSWGVTPDLKLKPEITGVGGNMYSTVDPALSGSYYGYMSGTSMATPQIAGAMSVLIEYLDENYPELTGVTQRKVAANLLMSTANPVLYSNGLEYSPRNQGAGLADLVKATTSEAYLSNPAASESRPKVEFGDDDAKNGVYEFEFAITNMSGEDKTYAFSSSVLTEQIYEESFIAGAPYGLEAKVEVSAAGAESVLRYDFNGDGAITTADARVVLQYADGTLLIDEANVHYAYLDVNSDGTVDAADAKVITDYCAELDVDANLLAMTALPVDQVMVPANTTVTLYGKLTLTDADKAYLDQFPNGIYVEGFLYAAEVGVDTENAAPITLTMPMLGFYGDWSAADVYDRDDMGSYSLYPTVVYTYYSELGRNPYFRNGRSGDAYNAFSYANFLYEMDFGQLRNVKKMTFTVTDNETGEVYHTLEGTYLTKSYYSATYGVVMPTYLQASYGELWDGNDAKGNPLPSGTTVTYTAEAWLDDGDDVMDDTFSMQMSLDTLAPEVLNAYELQESLVFEGERTYLSLTVREDQHLAAILFESPEGVIMGKYEIENVPGETFTQTFDITGFGNTFTIVAADYACNETEIDAVLNLGEQNNAKPEPQALSKDRLYGCETFDGALVEAGWFSANKADFSDPRNETFDSANRYYSAEYVNGYLVAQNANTGHLELVTPSGSYWATQVLCENNGGIGDPNVWVLYDMALDHSGTLSAAYGVAGEAYGTDGLFATGWMYKGDQDDDGHDDGYNALFNIKFTTYGSVMVNEIGRISGTENGGELLTLGITTEGEIYGIDTDGILYSVGTTTEWDDETYTSLVKVTKIGATDFVEYPNYGGTNVIQSMGYDHNTGTMYWYAHSQVANGSYYDNINVTYAVDLETAECTEVGSYGAGGQTALFVPNDLESDLFTIGVDPTNMAITPNPMSLVEGQTKRLSIKWTPWNAEPADVTWETSDAAIAAVDEYGFVTAVGEGTATISASAEMMLGGEWGWLEDGSWGYIEPYLGVKTVTCEVTIVPSEDELYSFVVSDFANTANNSTWVTYSDKTPGQMTVLGKYQVPVLNEETGETELADAYWNGGAYFNGYVYAVASESFTQDNVIHSGTSLYRVKVTEGATSAGTTFGEPEFIGFHDGVEVGNLGFDYNTSRMYGVDLTGGGLVIVDLDTGYVDQMGSFNGDLGAAIATAMCVTADGTIVVADMYSNLYTVNPDTLTTTNIYSGNADSWFYAGMTYDYNTGSIYWNPCMNAGASPLYLVRLGVDEWDPSRVTASVVDMGDVSSKQGVEQTILFAIPDDEPEAKVLPVESIFITNGATIGGLEGGTAQLTAATVPTRPTVQTKTWTSSDEDVVTVDRYGKLTYTGVGTATVTVSITNKDEATYGGPFTDSIEVTVQEAAGEFVAFLNADDGGSGYYDFWISGNDYDLRHATPGVSMISIYSLRTGAYYDGNYYAYNDKGDFLRISAENPANYKVLGKLNLDTASYQVTGMAMDYAAGVMYGLTLPNNYDLGSWSAVEQTGQLVTIDLDTGSVTKVADLDFTTPVYALACDADGQLYAAGGYMDMYATRAEIYKLDKTTGELTAYTTIPDAGVYTGGTYYGNPQYNTQMTYDFGTDRIYLYATTTYYNYKTTNGMYMVQLGQEPEVTKLDGISLATRAGSDIKYGDVYLGLLAFLPEEEEIPVGEVNGIILNKNAGRVAVGKTSQLVAQVRPSNALDTSLTWSSSDESVAIVNQGGIITGISVGTATITVRSNQTGITNSCVINVVDVTGEQSVAYTVSAQLDSLVSFSPALPGQTAEIVSTLSGGSTIKGMAVGDGCLYYLVYSNWNSYLYRYDLLTGQSVSMGQIYMFNEPTGMAYDPVNNMIYTTGGFYLYQYQVDALDPAGFNYYSNYVMDSDYCTLSGVACIDGAVYTIGNDYYTSASKLMKYSDKYLSDRTVLLDGFDVNVVAGSTDFAYDSSSGLFYLTDAGHTIYSMDMAGNVEAVDVLGDGIDLNGLAILPAASEE